MIAKGASGGQGRLTRRSSHGAVITALIKLNEGQRFKGHWQKVTIKGRVVKRPLSNVKLRVMGPKGHCHERSKLGLAPVILWCYENCSNSIKRRFCERQWCMYNYILSLTYLLPFRGCSVHCGWAGGAVCLRSSRGREQTWTLLASGSSTTYFYFAFLEILYTIK